MKTPKIRLEQIRSSIGPSDDGKGSIDILKGVLDSLSQEDVQALLLSRLREVIFGPDANRHWYSDFRSLGIPSLSEISAANVSEGICLSTDDVGDVVCVNGEPVNGRVQVCRVDISDATKIPAIGIITAKTSDTACTIVRSGLVPAALTSPKGLCFVGVDGRPTITRPSPSFGRSCFVQVIGAAMGSNQILLNPSFNLTLVRS